MRVLCEALCDVNKKTVLTGSPALFAATERGHMKVVQALCGARADVNLATDAGLVPLHAAAKNGNLEMLLLLFNCRAETDKATRRAIAAPATPYYAFDTKGEPTLEAGITPLFLAAQNGHTDIVRFLCTERADASHVLPATGGTPLHAAVRSGQADVLKLFIEEGVRLNTRLATETGHTPLLVASSLGHTECVQILCDARADINVSSADLEATAVHLASTKGHVDVIRILCKMGADVNKSQASGASAVHVAALHGHTEVVRSLCTARAEPDQACNIGGSGTPLFVAAKNGHLEIVKILCLARCDVRRASFNNMTPLHVAAMSGHVELVERLLRSRADLVSRTAIGATALHLASLSNRPEVVRLLCQARADKHASAGRGGTPLMMAVLCGHPEVVDMLCEEDPKRQAKMLKQTALLLHVAARNGHDGIVWRLCKCGANVNEMVTQEALDQLHDSAPPAGEDEVDADMQRVDLNEENHTEDGTVERSPKEELHAEAYAEGASPDPDKDVPIELEVEHEHPEVCLHVGATPMFMAALYGRLETVKVLYEAGAQIDKTGAKDGATPFIVAAQQGHLEVVKCLLDFRAQVNRCLTDIGATAIYLAAESGQREIVNFLCKYRADLNQPTSDCQQPPLLAAALHNHFDIVDMLCAARADIDGVRSDASQDTTLTLASEYGFHQTCRILLEARANPNKAAGSGAAPLLLAAEHGHESLVQLLCAATADPNQALKTSEGIAPLPVAARRGFLQIVEHLLRARANPNMKCFPAHLSAIMLATESSNACLGHTLSIMPDTRYESDVGTPVLFVALLNERVEVVRMLCRYKADPNKCADDQASPLLCAAKTGVIQSVKILCEAGANVNFACAPQISPLHWAAGEGQFEIVEYLSQLRADVNQEAHDGRFPLCSAVATDELENSKTVQVLLAARADCNKRTIEGATALILAAEHHQVDAARCLLEAHANIEAATTNGTTALLMAAEVAAPCTSMAELLLEQRSMVDRANLDFGATALHIAASRGHLTLVERLLQQRAQVDCTSAKGHTPLHFACWWNHAEVVSALLHARADKQACVSSRPGVNAFLMAVLQDNPAVMKVLCEDTVRAPQGQELCTMLLHVAARNGQSKIVDYLGQLGCNLNRAVEEHDLTDLCSAAQSAQCLHPSSARIAPEEPEEDADFEGEVDDFEEDVMHGGGEVDAGYAAMNVEVDLHVGDTPLYLAAFHGHDDLVYTLLSSRADPNFAVRNRGTPLMAAAAEGFPAVVRALCESRANLDCTDHRNRTALFIAAEEARTDVVAELLSARANVNKGTGSPTYNLTPLHMAVSGNCTEMVCLLCSAGAHIEAVRASLQQTLRCVYENTFQAPHAAFLLLGHDGTSK